MRSRTVIASPKLFASGVDHWRPPALMVEFHRAYTGKTTLLRFLLACRRQERESVIIEYSIYDDGIPLRALKKSEIHIDARATSQIGFKKPSKSIKVSPT